ncbi:Short chain dehydrogenase andI [Talaromyces pinophilus]|nr:Short chain dehydrogenase andI [Talaromyces pinophilus]
MASYVSFTKTWHNKPYPAIDPRRPELQATGKFVVVTGGGTGIGKAIAIAFAQAGAKTIAILGRRLGRLEEAALEIKQNASDGNTRVLVESVDISKRADLDAAVASLSKKAGGAKIDILVSNAGISTDYGQVVGYDEAEFRRGLEIIVIGAFNTIQSFSPQLAANAHIFNISSGMAHIKPIPGFSVYSTAKATVIKMFDYLQEENPTWHINQVQPGVIATEQNAKFGVTSQDEPELVSHFLTWLASPDADFLKGKFVWANWDVNELEAQSDEIKNSLLLRVILNGATM